MLGSNTGEYSLQTLLNAAMAIMTFGVCVWIERSN